MWLEALRSGSDEGRQGGQRSADEAGHEEELAFLNLEINASVGARNTLVDNSRTRLQRRRAEAKLWELCERVRKSRRNMKRRLRQLERELWEEVIQRCEESCRNGDMGEMYRHLRKIGTRGAKEREGNNITAAEFKTHFEIISGDRYERLPAEIEQAVSEAEDLRGDQRATEANDLLNEPPSEEEVIKEIKAMKNSAPGKDGVRLKCIRASGVAMEGEITRLVQFMFSNGAHKYDEKLKTGQIVPLFKKGDRNDKNNYRGVCLLSMGSRILAKVLASRLRWWSEHLGLTDDEQCGFRPGHSTVDATQVLMRIEEDVKDLRKRRCGRPEKKKTEDRSPGRGSKRPRGGAVGPAKGFPSSE